MFTIVTIILAVLKSVGIINWSWWIVATPAMIEWAITLLIIALNLIVLFIGLKK